MPAARDESAAVADVAHPAAMGGVVSAAGAAAVPPSAAGRSLVSRAGRSLSVLGALLLAATVFLPYPISRVVPASVVAVLALELLLVGGAFEADRAVARRSALWGLVLGPVLILVVMLLRPTDASPASTSITTLVLVAPLGVVAGRTLHDAGLAPALSWVVLACALGVTGVAIGEALLGRSLFGMQLIVEGGRLRPIGLQLNLEGGRARATAGSLHPLVLGLLLCASMALAAQMRARGRRIPLAGALYAGVVSTGSDGPIALGALVLLTAVFPGLLRLRRFAVHGVAVLVALVTVLTVTIWKAQVPGLEWSQYSLNYRPAIYALVPAILRERPFGYGLEGLPPGRWVIPTELRGPWDVSTSVDSEAVLLASELGLLGLAAFVVMILCAARWFQTGETPWALAFLVVVSLGLIVALHAWISVALFGAVAGGIAWGASRTARTAAAEESRGAHE